MKLSPSKPPVYILNSFILLVLIQKSDSNPVPETPGKHPFVGAFVFPHGGITLDPQTRDFSKVPGGVADSQVKAIRLHEAMRLAARSLVQTKPDLIILSTPHGFYLEEHYILAAAPSMSGNSGWGWENFTAKFNIARPESVRLYWNFKEAKLPIELLSLGIGESPLTLHWGEVIPWWFIQTAATELGFKLPAVVYMGQPPKVDVPELLKLGQIIADFARKELHSRRVAVVISGDLSHRHSNDPQAPYPFDKSAPVFDGFIRDWAQIDRNSDTEQASNDSLLVKAKEVESAAGSCGYSGLVMLHGMLGHLVQLGAKFNANFYEYAAPTYFGMTVTSWLPS